MNSIVAARPKALLALVAMVATLFVAPAQPAKALAPLTLTDLYSDTTIVTAKVQIAPGDIAALRAAPTTYVPATIVLSTPSSSTGLINVGFKLKGTTSLAGETNLADITARPSIKIKFNYKSLKKQRLLGLKHLTLNSMAQDTSHIHEWSAYKLFNAMNVQAPSTGWANVSINGIDRGLYVNIETPDDIFLSKHYSTPSQHLYEGVALADLMPGNDSGTGDTGAFTTSEGYSQNPSKADLTKLIAAANSPLATWWKQMATLTDRSQFIREFAVENFIGHWDGYTGPIINNYYLRDDMQGYFSILPWGTDQTFGENRATAAVADIYRTSMTAPAIGFPWIKSNFHVATKKRGLLFRNCLAYAPCFSEYLRDLKAVSAKATSMKLTTLMQKAIKTTAPYALTNTPAEAKATVAFVGLQQKSVAALVAKYKVK
ncbi:MAG: hypothetical protein RLZZ626_928 [Actinomycetota bacterium]|jgi:spore coat protein CotH